MAKKKKAAKKATKKKATKKKGRKPAGAPEWLTDLKRGDRFREVSTRKTAIYLGYERDQSGSKGYIVRMKHTGREPMTYMLTTASLQKFFKKIASRKPTEAKKNDGAKIDSGETARERAIRKWLT